MTKKQLDKKRNSEIKVVSLMIQLYCRKHHPTTEGLCAWCNELLDYTKECINKCPFMETKTFCSSCKIHCYSNEMQDRIRKVMKFSGPRMFLYYPALTVKHMGYTLFNKLKID